MGEGEETHAKWEGEVTAKLNGAKADEIWPLLADFCNIYKWFPIDISYKVEIGQDGEGDGEPDDPIIRYCSVVDASSSTVKWAKEKLLLIDPIERVLSYEILDNNLGFKSYVATVKVTPMNGDDDGCKIVWSFVSDPIEGWRFDDLIQYIQSTAEYMAEKMGDFVRIQTTG